MKKIILFCSCLLAISTALFAQVPQYFVGTGTGGNSIPFGGGTWADQRCQFLYLPGEFGGTVPSGLITKVYFRSSGSAASTYTNLQIDLGNAIGLTSLPVTSWITGLTTGFTASSYAVAPTVGGWVGYQLQTPVYYNSTQPLVVDTRQTATSGGYAIYTSSATGNRRQYAASGAGAPGAGSATLYDFGFDLITCSPTTAINASNITVTGASLSWPAVSGSLGYEYKLDQNPASPTGSGTFTAATSYVATGLALNTTYYFHVRNICASGYSPWFNGSFTTLNAYCLPPNNILFTNISKTSVDLLWSLMPTSDSYEYKVDLTPNPPLTSANTISTTAISAQVTGLQPGTKYYVFMRSICLGGADSSYWKKDSFVTKFYCDAPEVIVTAANTTSPTATWLPVPDAVAYEYAVTNTTAVPAFGTETLLTTLNLTLLADGKDKYLHVRSKCNSQFTFSNWVTKELYTIPVGITNVNVEQTFDVYPNPATNMLAVEVKGTDRKNAIVQLLDVTGKAVITAEVKDEKTLVNISRIAPGMYILKYTDAGFTAQKMISKK